jgi:raffinose/stachyose/melibiose transport system permease protein
MAAYVFLIVLAIIYIAPMIMLVLTSVKTTPEFNKSPVALPTSLALENFVEAWNKANFPRYLLNTVLYTVVSATIFVITGTFLSVAIARRFVKGSNAVFTLFLIALFLPPALIPQFQLILRLGLYNNPLGYILLFLVNPIGIVILVNYIATIPRDLDEAAAIEGCGYIRYVIQIVIPLAKPAIATVAVLHAIGVWNELVLATIYLTKADYYPITRGLIVFNGIYGANWPVIAAAVLMIAAPMAIFFVYMQKYIIGGVTAGAVKG